MSETLLIILGTVFAAAAVAKLRDRPAFEAVLRGLVGRSFARGGALLVIALELLLAATLLLAWQPRITAIATLAVLVGFTRILMYMRKKQMKGCGCFGERASEETVVAGIVRNLLLMLAVCVIVVAPAASSPWTGGASLVLARLTLAVAAWCAWSLTVAVLERRGFLPFRGYFVSGRTST